MAHVEDNCTIKGVIRITQTITDNHFRTPSDVWACHPTHYVYEPAALEVS